MAASSGAVHTLTNTVFCNRPMHTAGVNAGLSAGTFYRQGSASGTAREHDLQLAEHQVPVLAEKWRNQYPSCVKSWEENWEVLSTFYEHGQRT